MREQASIFDFRNVLVSDGATGTNLHEMGLEPGTAPEEWVLHRPDDIKKLHRSFIDAGSDVILTCSFGGNAIRLQSSDFAEQDGEINRTAASLARAAIQDAGAMVLLGGSMGPTGEMVEPFGMLTPKEVTEIYRNQAENLVKGGVDFLALETFFAIEEAEAALEGVRQVTDLPVVLTFSYDRGVKTMMGVTPRQMFGHFAGSELAAVGANCGTTLENMAAIVRELAACNPAMPIWAKPNAGLPQGQPAVYPAGPEEMGRFAQQFVDGGARIVGGCCGSTPEHIAAIASAVKQEK